MDERDRESLSAGHELASEVGERVRSIISAAEAAANAVRHEAEQTAAVRRRVAEEEAHRVLEDAKADADAYLAERIRRIEDLSDTVVERAETIVSRLDRAEEVRRQLQTLADALGESAEKLADDVRVGAPPPTVRGTSPAAPSAEQAAPRAEPPPVETSAPEAHTPTGEPAPAVAEPTPPPAEPEDPTAAAESAPASVAEPAAEPRRAPDIVPLERREPAEPAATAAERGEADDQLGARLVALQMAVAGGNRGEVEAHLRRTFELADPSSILDDVFGQGTDSGKRVAWPSTGDGVA